MGVVPWPVAKQQLKMGKGQNEGGFSEEQVQMYKDCFKLMDINKDGQLDKNDLRGAFDNVGVLMSESELDGLLGEISGPCTCDNMIKMFQEKMAGEATTPTTSSSRPSRLTTTRARSTPRCSSTPLRPRTSLACSSPSRRSPRLRSLPPLRKPLRPSLRRMPMPRRRRRRRRRPPSKLAVFSTFMPRLWLPLKRPPTIKTPHSK